MVLINYKNEYDRLRKAVIYIPSHNEIEQKNPEKAMYLSCPNPSKVVNECNNLINKLRSLNVDLIVLKHESSQPKTNNMIYLRDVAFVFRNKIFLGYPKYSIRSKEPLKFYNLIKNTAPGIASKIVFNKKISMEGADLLVEDAKKILIYQGGRTDIKISDLINREFNNIEYINVSAKIRNVPQHLLGAMHIIDKDLYCVRKEICNFSDKNKRAIKFSETEEIINKFSMNIITIGPKEILMPSSCPNTKKVFEKYGIICHEVEINEITKMGGGLACMLLPLERKR